jgi:hypothetical protein
MSLLSVNCSIRREANSICALKWKAGMDEAIVKLADRECRHDHKISFGRIATYGAHDVEL